MKNYKIFLLSNRYKDWCKSIKEKISFSTSVGVSFSELPNYYAAGLSDNYRIKWAANRILDSDIVIVDLNEITDPIIIYLLGYIRAINTISPNHIDVVTINSSVISWNDPDAIYSTNDIDDAVDYISANLLL